MNKIYWCTLILVFYWSASSAQDVEYAKKTIQTLASPEFHGRGYAFKGDSIAAEFIKDEFEKIGLLPVRNSYFQSFKHNVNVFPGEASLTVEGQPLKPGVHFLIDPASAAGKGSLKAETLTTKEIIENQWLEKVRKNKNKALLIDLREQDLSSPSETKTLREFSEYLKYEEKIAAKAIVFLHKGKIPWHVSSAQALRPSFILFMDNVDVNPTQISFDVEASLVENYVSRNVVGYLPGSTQNDSSIVITAHYDHLGRMGRETYFPGANDNASGVALLLDLARKLKENPPQYNTYFIAFAGEEAGLVGSKYFTEHPLINLQDIKFLLNLDLAGTGEAGITAVNGAVYKDYFETLKTLNDEMGLMKEVKARGEACNSDHCFFHQKEVPSFFIYTLGGTKFYHDIFDKAETLPLKEYENYFTLLYQFISGI